MHVNNDNNPSPLIHCEATAETSLAMITFTSPVLTAQQNEQLTDELVAIAKLKQFNNFILDLSSIRMISSQTLSVFLTLRKKIEGRGKVVLSGIDPGLYRVFKITGLHNLFSFYKNREEAIQSFQ